MSRQYTPWLLKNEQTIRADALAKLGYGLRSEARRVHGSQLPPEVVGPAQMQGYDGSSSSSVANASSAFWHYQGKSVAHSTVNEPVFELYPDNSRSSISWTRFEPAQVPQVTPSQISINYNNVASGAIKGACCLDYNFRCTTNTDTESVVDDLNTTPWVEFGIRVNGVLVSTTGKLYNAHETITMHYLAPVSGGPVTVDLVYRVYFGFLADPGDAGDNPTYNVRPLLVHNALLYALAPRSQ